ncbi:MAG: site-2 protease family protein, partial [Synergistaceae bacterium]|nr:site-2 protease family protein [Synergistaceae bacterium]
VISTVKTVWESLLGIIKGQISFKNMSGPIGIASVIGEKTSEGLQISVFAAFMNIFSIMTFITINLGVANLLPLPALDGGRIIFVLLEMIVRRRLPNKVENWIHMAGFVLLISLMILITCKDVYNLFFTH